MKKVLFIISSMMLMISLNSCGGVKNDPEAIADYVVKCLKSGKTSKLNKYSFYADHYSIKEGREENKRFEKAVFKKKDVRKKTKESWEEESEATVIYDLDYTEDGERKERTIAISLKTKEGKWLYAGYGEGPRR